MTCFSNSRFAVLLLLPAFTWLSACNGPGTGKDPSVPQGESPEGAATKVAPVASGKYKLKVTPVSDTVPAGLKFEALIEVEGLEPGQHPEFLGAGVSVDRGGMSAHFGQTTPGGFRKGERDKNMSYTVKARIPLADGTYEEIVHEGSFTVHSPDMIVTPATDQVLYRNCANTITVQVPSLGEYYNPVFTATEAQVIPTSSDKRKIVIVPTGKTCDLRASSNVNGLMIPLGTLTYQVQDPPLPQLMLTVGGKNQNKGISVKSSETVTVKIVPDEGFQKNMPKDCRYTVKTVNVYTLEGGVKKPAFTGSGGGRDAVKGIPLDLARLKGKPAGTTVIIEVDGVNRSTFQGKTVEVLLPSKTIEAKLK